MIFAIYFVLFLEQVFGHENTRYSGTIGTAYNVDSSVWYRIADYDTVGQCATLCTYYGCNMFETMLFDDISWSDFRGFRCYINIGDIE